VPVSIANVRYALLPSPTLTLERVTVGKLREIKIDKIGVNAGPFALLSDTKDLDDIEVDTIAADQDALAMVPAWVQPRSGAQPMTLRRVRLKAIKLSLRDIEIPQFDADVSIGNNGAVLRAMLSSGSLRADLSPKDKAWRATIQGHNWQAPLGPALIFDDIDIVAVIEAGQANLTNIEGKVGGRGTLKGAAKASWGSGIRVDGEFSVANGDMKSLMASYTRDFSITGALTTNATFSFQGASLKTLFDAPKVEATFSIERGELNNVDIVRAVQSPSRDGARGGKTRFESLTGSAVVNDKGYSYRRLQLASGAMNATGNVDVGSNGDLAGRVNAELGSKALVVARGNLTVAGSLKTPLLKP